MLMIAENIAGIAVELGFSVQRHFSRIFKKTVGIPPGKFSKIKNNVFVSLLK